MRRFRLSTLMLLIVIVALTITLMVRERRAARREAKLQAEIANLQARLAQSVLLPPQRQQAAMRMQTDYGKDLIIRLNRQFSGQ